MLRVFVSKIRRGGVRRNQISNTMNTTQKKLHIALFALLALFAVACEKVVSINLNNADPQLVIEAVVSDHHDSTFVKLSKSGDYFVPSLYFPPVSKAVVVISDDLGVQDTLHETSPGLYKPGSFMGAPGRTYLLSVFSDGKQYTALSTMPKKIAIDSLYTETTQGRNGEPGYNLYMNFRDPPELGNYYRMNYYVGALAADSNSGLRYRIYRDKLSNGDEVSFRMRLRRSVNPGDTVTVSLYSIDQRMYDYYNTMNTIVVSDRSPTLLAPANPNTNLSAGLGYFAAYAVDTKSIVLK